MPLGSETILVDDWMVEGCRFVTVQGLGEKALAHVMHAA